MTRRIALFILFLFSFSSAFSLETNTYFKDSLLYFNTQNFVYNALYGIENPTKLHYNKIKKVSVTTLKSHILNGNFKALDVPKTHKDLDFTLWGLQQMGRFSLEGSMHYLFTKQKQQRWNNTLMLSASNPFILADSIYGDPQQELFALNASANYAINKKWNVGLQLNYSSASRNDQTDPRPQTTSMRFFAVPGVSFQPKKKLLIGFNGFLSSYSSNLSFTSIDNLQPNVYFLMRGMGDHFLVSINENITYPRHYNGKQWGLSGVYNTTFSIFTNTLEMRFKHNKEVAEDGGSGAVFKGGDAIETHFEVLNGLSFSCSKTIFHHLLLSFIHEKSEGWWYEQRRKVDTEHANTIYYEVLHREMVHKEKTQNISLSYKINKFKENMPIWQMFLKGEVNQKETTHFEADVYRQQYTYFALNAELSKFFTLKNARLKTTAHLHYQNRLGSPLFNDVRGVLSSSYTFPIFAFSTAQSVGYGAETSVSFPIKLYKTPSWFSVFTTLSNTSFVGNSTLTKIYKNSHRTKISLGLSLTL